MTYILEHSKEAMRLEQQATMRNYNLKEEVNDLSLQAGSIFLDAGCGSGVLARYIANRFDNVEVEACDFSEIRLKQAKNLSQDTPIKYFCSNLEKLQTNDSRYDHIICRFVLEHLENPQEAVNEFYRAVKPQGQVTVIDVDGIIFNLYSNNSFLNKQLQILKRKLPFDLFIGRKIPSLLHKAGFANIEWQAKTMQFTKDDLIDEYELTVARLNQSRPLFLEIMKDEQIIDQFIETYLNEMIKIENTLFYTKFIVKGTK